MSIAALGFPRTSLLWGLELVSSTEPARLATISGDDAMGGGGGPYRRHVVPASVPVDVRRSLEGVDWARMSKQGWVTIDVMPFGPLLGIDDIRAAFELDGGADGPAARLILELQGHVDRLSETGATKPIRLLHDAQEPALRHLLSYRRLPGFCEFRRYVRERDAAFDRWHAIEREISALISQNRPVKELMDERAKIRRSLETAYTPAWFYASLLKDIRAARARLDADPIPDKPDRIARGAAEERLPAVWDIRADIVRHQVGLTMPWELVSIFHYGGLMDRVTHEVLHGVVGMSEEVLRGLFRNEIEDRGSLLRGMVPESLILHVFARILESNEDLGRDEIEALRRRVREREGMRRSDDIVEAMLRNFRHS